MLLIVLLACVSSHFCSEAFAEEQAMMNTRADRTDQAVQDIGIAKTPGDQPRIKKVLVLHALKVKRPWNVLFNRYFSEALQENNLTLANLEIENLDLLQFKDAAYKETVKKQLEHKYANSAPDVIIVTFASTIKFILENDLFPGIPKVFVLPSEAGFDEIPDSVVLPFAFEFKKNIEHALTLLPDTKNIYVVAGDGLMDRRLTSLFRDKTKEFVNRVSFNYLTDLNVEELLSRLEHLPDDSFVYYLTYSLDFQGKAVITRDFSQTIGERSNRPVFSWLDLHALGIRILGGRVTTTRASATMSVDIVRRVFEGETIDSIKPGPPYVEYIYDWRELNKWDIDLSKLPPDSVIQNRPYNFIELYKWRIMGVLFLLAVESLLILFLLINMRKRKEAERELRIKESAIASSINGIGLTDIEGKVIYVNDSLVEMWGYESAAEITGRLLPEFWDGDGILETVKILKEKGGHQGEDTGKRKDGSNFHVQFAVNLITDEDGVPAYMFGSFVDITARRQSEKKLLRISKAVESTSDAIGMADPRGNHFYQNSAFTKLLGYTAKELDAAGGPPVVYADKSVAKEVFDNIMSGKSWSGEIEMVSKSGRKFPALVRADAIKDESQIITGLVGIVTDITERKKLEETIHKRDERFNAFIRNSSEAIFCVEFSQPLDINLTEDEQIDHFYKYGYVSEANDVWAQMAGLKSGEELIGARLEEITPRSIPENIAFYKEMIRARYRLNDFETVEVYKTGVKIYSSNTITGMIENGHLVRVWGMGRDITEQKQLEKKLMMNKNDLQMLAGRLISNQEKELTRLARELHDDLTQQLAVTAIEAGSIEQDFKDLPEPVLNKIVRIKEQLIKTSKDVHNISRDLHPSILDDLGLERAVRSECSNFSSRTGIAVVFTPKNIPDNVPNELALSVYRIIQEGLVNITKHANSKNAYVFLEGADHNLLLTVRDTGSGFNKNEVRQQAALGLGSIRERARFVNGSSSITSSPGKGTTIEVKIPLKRE